MFQGFILTLAVIFLFTGFIGMAAFLVYIAVNMIIAAIREAREKRHEARDSK